MTESRRRYAVYCRDDGKLCPSMGTYRSWTYDREEADEWCRQWMSMFDLLRFEVRTV